MGLGLLLLLLPHLIYEFLPLLGGHILYLFHHVLATGTGAVGTGGFVPFEAEE